MSLVGVLDGTRDRRIDLNELYVFLVGLICNVGLALGILPADDTIKFGISIQVYNLSIRMSFVINSKIKLAQC